MIDYNKIFLGIVYGLFSQVGAFVQFQVAYKYGWDKKYYWIVILASLPLGWLAIKSTHYFIEGFDGKIWQSRLLGFSIGIIVFTIMSNIIFRESLSLKNVICILLGFLIVAIQLILK